MRRMIFLVCALLCSHAMGQVQVNGKVPGELWRTSIVSGDVEVFHPWGRTVVMPVKDAWVNVDRGRIIIGARCDDPVLDGKPRTGYMMADMSGPLQTEFPDEVIQTITNTEITGVGNNEEFRTTKTAMIAMKDGKPVSLVFTSLEYAAFDVPAFIAKLRSHGGEMASREIESLQGFDDLGFRQRTFRAVFDK